MPYPRLEAIELYLKFKRIWDSCKTEDQFIVAEKWGILLIDRIIDMEEIHSSLKNKLINQIIFIMEEK